MQIMGPFVLVGMVSCLFPSAYFDFFMGNMDGYSRTTVGGHQGYFGRLYSNMIDPKLTRKIILLLSGL